MPIITVSQLNNYMKRYIERNMNLSDLWVVGEISNYTMHYSGHVYISLKDENSSVRAIMFKSKVSDMKFTLKNGMRVIAFGRVSVFEREGAYRLYIENIVPDGTGELYAAYEQLKDKLYKKGLFSPETKRKLPRFPLKIGIVSSISGAAIKDIITVTKRRFPVSELCIYPAKVQGIGASESICKGIRYLDENTDCDFIIIARGGGTLEDLWAFNEECTAYAIYNCQKPIISAIGHETDYTISDFVADQRAPTPSAAAEIAVPQISELIKQIEFVKSKMTLLIDDRLCLAQSIFNKLNTKNLTMSENNLLKRKLDLIKSSNCIMDNAIKNFVSSRVNKTSLAITSLDALSPLKILQRGYSYVSDNANNYISFDSIKINDVIKVVFDSGNLNCVVREVNNEKSQ